jgi:hypothetical protein
MLPALEVLLSSKGVSWIRPLLPWQPAWRRQRLNVSCAAALHAFVVRGDHHVHRSGGRR